MQFLTPLYLSLAGLAIPIILLYMLKLRRREVRVSSTLLWQRLVRDREANAPWQRLRRNLLMLLQLLILAALVIALARPFVEVPSVASGTVAVLLDASASMNAADAPGAADTRFEQAQNVALNLVNDLAADEAMTVILAGPAPHTITPLTGDKVSLRAAINEAQPGQSAADWEAAFALAAASGQNSENLTVVVVSDGGLPDNLTVPPGEFRFLPVGTSTSNLAISALATRPTLDGLQLFASVSNYGQDDAEIVFELEVDGESHSTQIVNVPAGETFDLTVTGLPPEVDTIRAGLTPPAESEQVDYLPLDDQAWAVFAPPDTVQAVLWSEGNLFLEQMLVSLPGVEGFRAPDDGSLPETPFDLYVFDGRLPDSLPPRGNMLFINPPYNTEFFTVGEEFNNTQITNVEVADPLLAFVEAEGISVFAASDIQAPVWAQTLIKAEGGPLLWAGETNGRRIAVLTFDLHASDLPLQIAFPILMSNLMAWYAPSQAFSVPDGLAPGEPVTIRPVAEAQAVRVSRPDGGVDSLPVQSGGVIYADTGALGLYRVSFELPDEEVVPAGNFAVNLFAPQESDIRPATSIQLGESEIGAVVEEEAVGQLEFWPWLAGAALFVMLVEWFVYYRGAALSAGRDERTRTGVFAGRGKAG